MKKILTVCVLGLFLVGGVVGCGGSTTSATAPATTGTKKEETKTEKKTTETKTTETPSK